MSNEVLGLDFNVRQFIYTAPENILFDERLTLNELKIYMIVRSFMDTTGVAYPSNKWIADKLKIETRSVIRCLKNLVLYKYIEKKIKKGQRFLVTVRAEMLDLISEEPVTESSGGGDTNVTWGGDTNVTQSINSNMIISNNISIGDLPSTNPPKTKVSMYKNDTSFMRFYSIYPRKEKPKDAWKAFRNIVGDNPELLEQVINDITMRIKEHTQWQEKQYIPYPATYLRSESWDGEIFNNKKENEKEKAKNQKAAVTRQEEQEKASEIRRQNDLEKIKSFAQDKIAFNNIKQNMRQKKSMPSMEFNNLFKSLKRESMYE